MINIRRYRKWLLALSAWTALGGIASAAEPIDPAHARRDDGDATLWYDVQLIGVEGRGWDDTKSYFDRLPAKAEALVRPDVWNLSRHTAGMAVHFATDATTLQARWTLTSDSLAMPHMPATGVSGVDLYVRDEAGVWRWLANGRPSAKSSVAALYAGIPLGAWEYLMYLPLYNGVSQVELGLPEGAVLRKAESYPAGHDKPLVFYGTSITQGGCASRPGMVHTAILGRRLNRPVINLGFSGNGRMELEVATLLAELDAAVYVIDCLPNIGAAEVAGRTEPLVRTLRGNRPRTPIVMVEDRTYSDAFLIASKRERNKSSRAALRKVFDQLRAAGESQLYYLSGEHLLGEDNEGTVDSSHPTDLGFFRQADALEPVLREALAESASN